MICLELGGRSFHLSVEKLHRRFFYQGGVNMHSHDVYHFILISRGECRLLQPDRAPVHCPNHSLVMINPGWPHDFKTGIGGVEHCCLIAALQDDAGQPSTISLEQFFQPDEPAAAYRLNQLTEGDAGEFLGLLTRAAALYRDGSIAAEWAIAELFMLGARLSLPEYFVSGSSNRQEQLVAQIRDLVEQELRHADFSLEMLGKQLNLHQNHLNAIFRKVEHVSIGEYLIQRRLQRACQMLAAGERSKDIAVLCGFSSPNYFCRLFRQRIGCSPTEFQATRRGGAMAGSDYA